MNKTPLVSVIIPVYNGAKYIESLLESFSNQTYDNFELIFINDGSTDNILEIIRTLKDKYCHNIQMFSQENKGVSAARNLGIDKSAGEYICFCDVDDYFDHRYIEQMLNVIFENNLSFAVCKLGRNISSKNCNIKNQVILYDENTFLEKFATLDIVVVHYCLLINKEYLIHNKIRFSEGFRYGEDYDFAWKVIINGKNKIGYINYPLYNYIWRKGSAMTVFNETRYDTVRLYAKLEEYIEERNRNFSVYFNKYWIARSVWSTMRQASSKVSFQQFLKIIDQYDAKTRLRYLHDFKDKRIAFTSRLLCFSPKLFYFLFKTIIYKVN